MLEGVDGIDGYGVHFDEDVLGPEIGAGIWCWGDTQGFAGTVEPGCGVGLGHGDDGWSAW